MRKPSSAQQPVYMRAGEIFEPVKFYMSKNSELRAKALSEVFSQTTQVFFQLGRSAELSVKGQALYTFNPKTEGSRLYAKRGMELMANFSSNTRDGVDWHVFASKIESYMQKYHEPTAAEKEADNAIAVDTIDSVRSLVDRVLKGEVH